MFASIRYPVQPIVFLDDLSIHIYINNQNRFHTILGNTIKPIVAGLSHKNFCLSPAKSSLI